MRRSRNWLRLESQAAAALRLRLLREAEGRRVADRVAATGTDAWAAALTGETREAVRGGLILAHRLAASYPATRDAFAEGRQRLAQGPGHRQRRRAGPG